MKCRMNVLRAFVLLLIFALNSSSCVFAQSADDALRDAPELKFSPLELLAIAELNLRGKSEPKKPATDRLEECERVSGLTTEITASLSFDRRLFDLLQEAPISSNLMDYVESKSLQTPEFFKRKQYLFSWYATLYQMVAACEIAKYSEPSLGKSFLKRVERMERDVLKLDDPPDDKNLSERVSAIFDAIEPTGKHIFKAVEATDKLFNFVASADSPPSSRSREDRSFPGADAVGDIYRSSARVLKSPTFWKVVGVSALVGGAVVGAVFLARSGSGGGGNWIAASERGCVGDPLCSVCKNCNYCAHCKNPYYSRPCGVYFRVRGLVP